MKKIQDNLKNDVHRFFDNLDNRINHVLQESIQSLDCYSQQITFPFTHINELSTISTEGSLSYALDYLFLKVKDRIIQNLYFEISILEDRKQLRTKFMDTNKFTSLLVLDITGKKMKTLSKYQLSELKKSNVNDFEFEGIIDDIDSFVEKVNQYQNILYKVGKSSLQTHYSMTDPFYNYIDVFKANFNFVYDPNTFIKKDFAFLYSDDSKLFRKIRNKKHTYLSRYSASNFYYIAFLIKEFSEINCVFKSPKTFFDYYKNTTKKQNHEKKDRDFKRLITTYEKHISSADEYKKKLVTSMKEKEFDLFKKDSDRLNSSPLLNYYFLVNNSLRTDFFSSLDSSYIQLMLSKIPIEKLILALQSGKNVYNQSPGIYSIDYCFNQENNNSIDSNIFFYLNLLELTMLFNIDTNLLSKLRFYEAKKNTEIEFLYQVTPMDIYFCFMRVVSRFLNQSMLLVSEILQEGIDLYHQLDDNSDDICYFTQSMEDYLNVRLEVYYDFEDYKLCSKDLKCVDFTNIENLYNKDINKQLVVCYLLNSCARNRFLIDFTHSILF